VANNGLRVFYECSGGFRGGGCDSREFRTQIDWVNWVRDRQDAQVHVIITSQETGSGGNSYQLDFIGLEGLEGVTDQLAYTSLGTDVRDETVQGLTRVLAVGLARYSLLSGSDAVLEIRQPEGAGVPDRLVTSDQVDDPWDFWVFRVSTNSSLSGESRRSNARAGGSFSATRVTPDWKFEFDAGGNWRESKTEVDDTTTYVDTRRDWRAEMGLAYSLADHWSVGTEMRASAATQTNQDLSVSLNTALEYSIWPYEEATRRSLRLRYIVGMRHFNYEEETLFGLPLPSRLLQAPDRLARQPLLPHRPRIEPQRGRGRVLGLGPALRAARRGHQLRGVAPPAASAGQRLRLGLQGRILLPVRVDLQQRGEQPVLGCKLSVPLHGGIVLPYPLACDALLDDVGQELDAITDRVRERFGGLNSEQLVWQADEDRWGVGHCLVHLARLNELYRIRLGPALKEARARGREGPRPLRGSWFGRWFTSAVGPEAKRRVQTPPIFRPRQEVVVDAPLESFLAEQIRLRSLVEEARGLDLDRIRVTSPVSPLLRFKVSDAFRILVEHERRHLDQADAVMVTEGFPS
jgi:hypothetical protein